ncbi:hypothetical protein FM112_16910 [Gulosibacter sp. 10]|nr:hypothetical protein FM112_16910 [Gulosibacter sp. 10]
MYAMDEEPTRIAVGNNSQISTAVTEVLAAWAIARRARPMNTANPSELWMSVKAGTGTTTYMIVETTMTARRPTRSESHPNTGRRMHTRMRAAA